MSTLKYTIATITDRGLNPRRTANEDRLLTIPESGLYLVADGVGGHRGGQVASQTAVDVFSEVFSRRPTNDLVAVVRQTIAQANGKIFKASHEVADLEGMASTLAIVAIEGMRAIIAHELGHVQQFNAKARWRSLAYVRMMSPAFTAQMERRTDLLAIARGYGAGLRAYREWLYQHIPANRRAEKLRNYFAPEEIDALLRQLQSARICVYAGIDELCERRPLLLPAGKDEAQEIRVREQLRAPVGHPAEHVADPASLDLPVVAGGDVGHGCPSFRCSGCCSLVSFRPRLELGPAG